VREQRNVMEVVGAQWLQRSAGRERREGGLDGLGVAEEKGGMKLFAASADCCVHGKAHAGQRKRV
jgi:hypothetical protein